MKRTLLCYRWVELRLLIEGLRKEGMILGEFLIKFTSLTSGDMRGVKDGIFLNGIIHILPTKII